MPHKGSHDTDEDELHKVLCVAPLEAGPAVRSKLIRILLQFAPGRVGGGGVGMEVRKEGGRREGILITSK